MAIDVLMVSLGLDPWGCIYPFFYNKGGEVIRKVTESVTT
jgi:hypothetical protein